LPYSRAMPRSSRHVEPGAFHHVSPRGNDGRPIYEDEADRRHHLSLLERVTRDFGWIVFGYCQMTNHYHLVLQDPLATLSRGMQKLQGDHARYEVPARAVAMEQSSSARGIRAC